MADIEQAIATILRNDAGVTALVKGRIRPIAAAQWDVFPYVGYYSQIPEEQFDHFTGDADTRRILFTIDIWGKTYGQCKAVSRAIRAALHLLNDETVEDVYLRLSKHTEDNDLSEPPNVGEANPIKRISSNYLVLYLEV